MFNTVCHGYLRSNLRTFHRFLIHGNFNTYVVSLYTQCVRYSICSTWFLDIRISSCLTNHASLLMVSTNQNTMPTGCKINSYTVSIQSQIGPHSALHNCGITCTCYICCYSIFEDNRNFNSPLKRNMKDIFIYQFVMHCGQGSHSLLYHCHMQYNFVHFSQHYLKN